MIYPQVEKELEELTDVLKSAVPSLLEVRVFGSYENGNWKPSESDIDIYILVGEWGEGYDEAKIRSQLKGNYRNRFHFSFSDSVGFNQFKLIEGPKGNLGKNVTSSPC
jgi:predicted nucleotidyltransferase